MLVQAQAFVNSLSGQATIAAIVVEAILRLIKSEKPLSIAYVIADSLKKIGDIASKLGAFADKVLPQRLK
jgi:DNA-binding HxlR family transcriptional regulator